VRLLRRSSAHLGGYRLDVDLYVPTRGGLGNADAIFFNSPREDRLRRQAGISRSARRIEQESWPPRASEVARMAYVI